MRIGEVTKDNYMEFMKMFGGNNSKVLDKLWGKDKKAEGEDSVMSQEEANAKMIAAGVFEDGMFIREGDESWKTIVPISDEIKEKLIETARRHFLTNGNGMGEARDGDEIGAMMEEYRANIPPSERASVTYTLSEIVHNENVRLVGLVKANDPTWNYGQKFDKSVIASLISGPSLDQKV